MLEIKRVFSQLHRKFAIVVLASVIWLISLPAPLVQAAGYYSAENHQVEINRPYYTTKERRIAPTETNRPYYTTKERTKAKLNTPATGEDYIESGKRAGEVIPKDLGTGSRQKNPINMLKRAGEELGNNPLKRSFGAKDYDRSEIEKELAENKAARGDLD